MASDKFFPLGISETMFSRPIVYFKVSAGSLTAEVVGGALSATVSCAALAHPRTLMGEFTEIQNAMKEALGKLGLRVWYKRAPITLTHLLPAAEGGYTNVELRAFREAALGAGSAQAYLLKDHPALSAQQQSVFTKFFGKTLL